MNINFKSLKLEFKEYLQSLGINPKLNSEDELTSASIFTYNAEFKEFIDEKYDINLEKDSVDLSELLETEIKDGKFVVSEDDEIADETSFMMEFLNDLFEDEDFSKNIEEDGVDGLSNDEIKKFLTFANDSDKDEEKISFEDIEKGFKKAEKGKYDASKVELDSGIQEQTPVSNYSGSGGGTGANYNSNTNIKNNNQTTTQTNKNYSQMNSEELEAAYINQQTEITNQTQNVNDTISQNEQEVAKAKEAYDSAIGEDNVNPELLESRNQNLESITQTDSAINKLNSDITTLDTQIATCDSSISLIDGNLAALNSALSSLSSAPEDDEEAQAAIEAKRTSINQEIASLTAQKDQLQQEKTAFETQRTDAQTSLEENTTKLQELEAAKSQIEEQILQTCNENTKNALEAYNAARDAADLALNEVQNALSVKKEELTEIQNYLSASYAKTIEKDYGYSEKTDAFSKNEGYTLEKGDKVGDMSYSVVTPNNIDPNKEAPVMVYLHGGGGSERSLYSQIMQNYNLENGFNGYIVCPSANKGSWDNEDSAKDIEAILEEFSKTHKIDKDNIVIVGHSLGGSGALYMADSETFKKPDGFKFKKAAALTGYPSTQKQYDIPIGLWVDSGSKYLLDNNVLPNLDINGKDKYVDLVGQAHGQIDNIAFTQDTNNNGKADLLEWLFEE